MSASIPEEAIVDAVLFDPLAASSLLVHLANCNALSIRAGLLDDIARENNITSQKLESVLAGLLETGLLSQMGDGISLTVSKNDALRYAAVLLTTPEVFTVAIVARVLQLPPGVTSASVTERPSHTCMVPVIGAGSASTVTCFVLAQPPAV